MTDMFYIGVEVYQVKIGITASDNVKDAILGMLDEVFPHGYSTIKFDECEHFFKIIEVGADSFELYKDEQFYESRENKYDITALMRTEIRYTFSEFAVGKVIVHAGAVAIDDCGIIFPGKSRSGKSSIVAALIKRGAVYYSDDYAVLDGDALLYPHAKKISLRDQKEFPLRQTDYAVKQFGAAIGSAPVQIKLVIITEFEEETIWKPEKFSNGAAVMAIIPHTAPIRRFPAFTLRTLDNLARNADVYAGTRGDLAEFIPQIISLAEGIIKNTP